MMTLFRASFLLEISGMHGIFLVTKQHHAADDAFSLIITYFIDFFCWITYKMTASRRVFQDLVSFL